MVSRRRTEDLNVAKLDKRKYTEFNKINNMPINTSIKS